MSAERVDAPLNSRDFSLLVEAAGVDTALCLYRTSLERTKEEPPRELAQQQEQEEWDMVSTLGGLKAWICPAAKVSADPVVALRM